MRRFALPLLLLFGWFSPAQPANSENPGLIKAVAMIAQGEHKAAAGILEPLVAESPSEALYYYLGTAYWHNEQWAKAAAVFEDGASKFPLSARLHNAAAMAFEHEFDLDKAIPLYRKAIALDPFIEYTGGGRYDKEFDAIYMPVVHDHRGTNSCAGRLYVDGEKMHFVVYYVDSSWGRGNDDSFETPYAAIEYVEVDRKKGWLAGTIYSALPLLTNLTEPRRRIASAEQSRLDLNLFFKQPIEGYRGKSWRKEKIKFFFIEPEVGERFLDFLKSKGMETRLQQESKAKGQSE